MKKLVKKAIKLIDFLIRMLMKVVKNGTKVLDELKKGIDKASNLAPVLIEISNIIVQLEQKKLELQKLAEEE